MSRFEALLRKYRANRCTSDELRGLFSYIGADVNRIDVGQFIEQQLIEEVKLTPELRDESNEVYQQRHRRIYAPERPYRMAGYRWYAAAVLLLLGSMGSYYLIQPKRLIVADAHEEAPKPIVAGGNRATLTLANGETVVLTNVANGQLAKE